jgi:hypothetical protein
VAYKPNFYQAGNIVGYTGRIGESPTVYFMDDRHYGHITQAHDCPLNVGRELIKRLWFKSPVAGTDINGNNYNRLAYRMGNHPQSGVLVEWYEKAFQSPETVGHGRRTGVLSGESGRDIHTSRNPFNAVDLNTRPQLEESIQMFRHRKKRYVDEAKFIACCGNAMQEKAWTKCGPECPY